MALSRTRAAIIAGELDQMAEELQGVCKEAALGLDRVSDMLEGRISVSAADEETEAQIIKSIDDLDEYLERSEYSLSHPGYAKLRGELVQKLKALKGMIEDADRDDYETVTGPAEHEINWDRKAADLVFDPAKFGPEKKQQHPKLPDTTDMWFDRSGPKYNGWKALPLEAGSSALIVGKPGFVGCATVIGEMGKLSIDTYSETPQNLASKLKSNTEVKPDLQDQRIQATSGWGMEILRMINKTNKVEFPTSSHPEKDSPESYGL